MPEIQYTVHDTPRVVARLKADLDEIVDTVRTADPSLRSLVLTGGFARGEGSVHNGQPQNDYDLIAIRGLVPARTTYSRLRQRLEARLGLHIDLAPVGAWRLRRVDRSIFWYETALRGRVLWGEDLLDRIPVRRAEDIQPTEALRLLVNRAAGLLLATQHDDAHEHRIQASKALLAAADAELFVLGDFPPSQRERWEVLQTLIANGTAPAWLHTRRDWIRWAYEFKTAPDQTAPKGPRIAWRMAAAALLEAAPAALRHSGFHTLEDYEQIDGVRDHIMYATRAGSVAGARRFILNPTGRVRTATLRLLAESRDGHVDEGKARNILGDLGDADGTDPIRLLDDLRKATLQ